MEVWVSIFKQTAYSSLFTGFNDIGYSFLIGGDGVVYEGRGWNTVGAHTVGFNKQSYAISFIGNFMKELPDKLALKGTYYMIK